MNYAGFLRRLAAWLIDALITTVPSLLMPGSVHFSAAISLNFIILLLYKPVFESSNLCATPGKALLGIAVVSEGGNRLSIKQAYIRFLCSYLSFALLYIGFIMQLFTAKRQTLHDMISEAVVIQKESADLNYFTVWRDQFKSIFNSL